MVVSIGDSSGSLLGCVVHLAWQFARERFIANRGDIIRAVFGKFSIE